MNPSSRLRRGIVRDFFLLFLIASLASCNLPNPFSSSPAPTSTTTPSLGSVPITPSNVSRLAEAWTYIMEGTAQFSSSPIVTNPIVTNGVIYIDSAEKLNSEPDTLVARNARTATKLWSFTTKGSFTSQTIINGIVYVNSADYSANTNTLDVLDAKTGIKLWSYTRESLIFISPTVTNNVVYVGSQSVMVTADMKKSIMGTLDALDSKTGNKLWSYATDGFSGSPIVTNGVVYVNSSTLDAVDAKTGNKLWSYSTGGSSTRPPIVANGVVYIASEVNGTYSQEDNTLDALDAKTGTKLWSYSIGTTGGFSTPPTLANGVIYVTSDNHTLDALDAKTGTKRWSYSNSSGTIRGFSTPPTLVNGVIYVTSSEDTTNGQSDGTLDALDAKSGTKRWSYSAGTTSVFSALTVTNGVVYVSSADIRYAAYGALYAFNATSGTKMWNYNMGPGDSLSVLNGVVYIDSQNYGKLSALDANSGTRLWIYFTKGSLQSLPTVTNTMVYVNSRKILYAFAISIRQALTPTATSPSLGATTPANHLVPTINKAPVIADVPGVHIQSTEGLQCPLREEVGGLSDDLVFTTERLTYSKDEIQQIKNYLDEMLYRSESGTTAFTTTPPPTLQWVSGSAVCTLHLEISNTGNTTVQISSLGVQLTNAPQPNSSQSLHTLDTCSLAHLYCPGESGGGVWCGGETVNIALQAAPASSIFSAAPDHNTGESCSEPILHPNDTFDFVIRLSSPGAKSGSVAPYLYAIVPVLTLTTTNGSSHTFTLSSMAGIAAFVDPQQITCYGLLHDPATFVPVSTFPPFTYTCLA